MGLFPIFLVFFGRFLIEGAHLFIVVNTFVVFAKVPCLCLFSEFLMLAWWFTTRVQGLFDCGCLVIYGVFLMFVLKFSKLFLFLPCLSFLGSLAFLLGVLRGAYVFLICFRRTFLL